MTAPDHAERFWTKVAIASPDECWEWKGALNSHGYGSFWNGERSLGAHRYAYELVRGATIPKGLVTDHVCRNRKCVNPTHIDTVTNRENVLRGIGPTATHARKTHCKHGHPLTDDNIWTTGGTRRRCKDCQRRLNSLRRARLRAAKGATA